MSEELKLRKRTQLIKELHAQGKSAKEIATIAGCCQNNVYRAFETLKVKPNKVSDYKKPTKKRDQIFVLHRTGMMSSRIAKELDCSLQYVSRTLLYAGLKANPSCPVCAVDLTPKPGLRIMRAG